jgi:hypothetical protein
VVSAASGGLWHVGHRAAGMAVHAERDWLRGRGAVSVWGVARDGREYMVTRDWRLRIDRRCDRCGHPDVAHLYDDWSDKGGRGPCTAMDCSCRHYQFNWTAAVERFVDRLVDAE